MVVTISLRAPVRMRLYHADWRTELFDSVAQLVISTSSSSRAWIPA